MLMKRMYAFCIGMVLTLYAVLIPVSANISESVPVYADSETVYTIEDIKNLQNFLVVRETPDLSDKDYDLNDDNRWDVFDLCLMKQQYIKQQSQGKTLIAYFSLGHNSGNFETADATHLQVL